MSVTRVWVAHRFVGFHSWPAAPPHRSYLGSPHRHLFLVRAEVPVEHADRDVEFHDLLVLVIDACDLIGSPAPDGVGRILDAMSCEMIAGRIAAHIHEKLGISRVTVEVSEDGESGAVVAL